ncbi:MAG: PP2C family protein-serine/threonine phosphatase [Parahaliea sp.]
MTLLDTAGCSHRGTRQHNEDSLLLQDDIGLYVVADGVGGAQAGEVASGITCASLERQLRCGASLEQALEQAHRDILVAAGADGGRPGMASTAVAAVLRGTQLQLAWVGDSRAYLWDDALQLLTKDHSLVQNLVDTGQLAFEDMERHPQKHLITQALGSRQHTPRIDSKRGQLHPSSVLLLCSDGVSGVIPEPELIDILSGNDSATILARTLVDTALAAGSDDNASCIVIRLPGGQADVPCPPTDQALAFMRYGRDRRWRLEPSMAGEETQINPAMPTASTAPRNTARRLLIASLGLGLLLALLQVSDVVPAWSSLLQRYWNGQ